MANQDTGFEFIEEAPRPGTEDKPFEFVAP